MKKYYILLFVALVALSSCEKLLDKEPTDKLSIEDLFLDVQGAKSALAGSYKALLDEEHYNKNTMVYPEILAGNIKFSKNTNIRLEDVYEATVDAQESSLNATYSALYSELNNVNNVIKYTPSAAGSATEKIKIVAEAKAIRALIHFDLVRIFARPFNFTANGSHLGIPLILNPQLYSDPAPSRATVAQTYNAIVTDLTEAIAAFDDTNVGVLNGGTKQNYFTKASATALLAKVYLYQNNWDKAFELADELIKSKQYTLLTNANYVTSWTGRVPSSESIFELAIETVFSGTSLGAYYESTNLSSYRMYAATLDLTGLYSETDVRNISTMFNRVDISGVNYAFTKKYQGGGTLATPIKILRLSELHLIRAEAAVEKTSPDFTVANADLNLIRKRADASAATLNLTTKDAVIDAVLLERRKELAFEGNLLFDLMRRKKDINRADVTPVVKNLLTNDDRLIMPFPANTINANRNMKQNPGY
ncbi:RagB/SusD family nutrient uptake outer membrane protein [Pedobacter sp. SL55]|uniref:RagB/SusD family nutrient uptake outer membrane protein n=1 Tax=Pedobacter sp. SL55 TaxID=2995161 RepID=UPI00226EB496|nr:RagB/SusD family nutrient uptake outer membrane protein [Pedobacter sp. SL55]WAC42209.1 RagB/SusD family nutrient uptake outer membrane protein [Pedobacter sp. SL55]